MWLAARKSMAEHSALLRNSTLAFDGFTGFTPVQQTFLQAVFPVVIDSYVALTIDAGEDFYSASHVEQLFFLSKKTIHMLLLMARETGVTVAEPVVLGDGEKHRFVKAPLLYHLEQNLFRTGQQRYQGAPEDQKHIFDRYFHTTAQTKHESSGLGLTIARELTLLHRGTLSVESELERGTTFIARFALLQDEKNSSEAP